jgi:hypothetical protein
MRCRSLDSARLVTGPCRARGRAASCAGVSSDRTIGGSFRGHRGLPRRAAPERVVSCAHRRTRARLPRASRVVRAAQQRVVSCAQRNRESCRARSARRGFAFRERVVSGAQRNSESCRARSARRGLAFRERVVSCAQRKTRSRLPRASRVVRAAQDAVPPSESESCRARSATASRVERAAQQRVVSCAQLTTRPRLRASRVVRAAHDATSRRADASTWLEWLVEPRTLRPSEARPDRTTSIPPEHRRPPVTPRVVRSAHDTRRTYARPKLPRPVRARLVSRAGARDASRHVPKRERRKPQWNPKATDGRPNGTRPEKPCGRGDDALARSAPSAPPGFAGTCPVRRTRVQEAEAGPQHARDR